MKKIIVSLVLALVSLSAFAQINFSLSLGATLDNSGVGPSVGASIQSHIYGPLTAELSLSGCSRASFVGGNYLSPRADLQFKAEIFERVEAIFGFGCQYTADSYTVEQEPVEMSPGVFIQETMMYYGQFWNPVVTAGLEYNFTKHFGFKLLANFSDQYAEGNMKLVLGGTLMAVTTL